MANSRTNNSFCSYIYSNLFVITISIAHKLLRITYSNVYLKHVDEYDAIRIIQIELLD